MPGAVKEVVWIGRSLREVKAFPEEVRREIGHVLFVAQRGDKHVNAKPMKGFGGSGVLEAVVDDEGGTYRAVYTVKFPEAVYVLDAFQKKSVKGIKTPHVDIERIKARLQLARAIDKERIARGER